MGAEPSSAIDTPSGGVEAIGVDLGGTKMFVGVVGESDTGGLDVHHRSEAVSAGLSTDQLLDTLESELREAARVRPGAGVIGLGVPCTIDQARGVAISAVNLPIKDLPIRDMIAERLGLPVFLDNDANTAALAEHRWGAARGARNAVLLTIGTGIGGGLILDGRLYRGSTGAGAELGHMVIEVDGPPCQGSCPNHGCAEAVASGIALGREARAAADRHPDSALGRMLSAGKEVDGRSATMAAIAGDEVAREVVAAIGERLGAFASGLANAFEPDAIVFGGGVLAAGDLLLDPIRAGVRSRALPPMNQTPVLAAELGPEAGMIGAATMALDEQARTD